MTCPNPLRWVSWHSAWLAWLVCVAVAAEACSTRRRKLRLGLFSFVGSSPACRFGRQAPISRSGGSQVALADKKGRPPRRTCCPFSSQRRPPAAADLFSPRQLAPFSAGARPGSRCSAGLRGASFFRLANISLLSERRESSASRGSSPMRWQRRGRRAWILDRPDGVRARCSDAPCTATIRP